MKQTTFNEEELAEAAVLIRRAVVVVKSAIDELADIAEAGLRIGFHVPDSADNVKPAEPERRLISAKELARRLGVSPVTVHRLRKQGLPETRIGYRVVFDYERVAQWVDQRNKDRKGPGSEPKEGALL
jgi:predicted DNA-binding transcriptional regulator AlpA